MKKIVGFFIVLSFLFSCHKTARPQIQSAKQESGYVILVSRGRESEWLLMDSTGNYLLPLNLSPALRVHKLKVYFSYEEISRREDGIPIVKVVAISIE